MTNDLRRELIQKARAAGFPGSYTDVFKAYDQGVDLVGEYQMQQQQQQQQQQPQMQVAQTPEEQRQGLIPAHQQGMTNQSMAFPNVQPNQSFTTKGLTAPIDMTKVDDQGNVVESYKSVPPGISNLPTGPNRGTMIETPASTYLRGGLKSKVKYQTGDFKKDLSKIDLEEITPKDSGTLTYVSPNIEIAKKQAPAIQKEAQRQKVEESKQGNRDQWGRPYDDTWYGFDPSTKQFTVRDAWGRSPQSEWYGFDPSSKSWAKGSKVKEDAEKKEYEKYDEALNYTKEYLESPMYKDMLQQSAVSEHSSKAFDFYDDARKRNLETTPPLQILPQPENSPAGGTSNSSTGQIKLYPEGFGAEGVHVHELSHSTDRPPSFVKDYRGRLIPKKDAEYIINNRAKSFTEGKTYLDQKSAIPAEVFSSMYPAHVVADQEKYFKEFYIDYVGNPTEVRARLNSIRKGAKDNNLYDPFTEKVTPEIYNKFLKDFEFEKREKSGLNPMKNLQEVFTDEEIIHMLNTISENKPSKADNINLAKYGGLKSKVSYQTGGAARDKYLLLPDNDYGKMRQKAYADSLTVYNQGEVSNKWLKTAPTVNWKNDKNQSVYDSYAFQDHLGSVPRSYDKAFYDLQKLNKKAPTGERINFEVGFNKISGQTWSVPMDKYLTRYTKPVQPIKLEPQFSKLPLKEAVPSELDYQLAPTKPTVLNPNAGYLTTDFGDTNTNVGERVRGRFNLEDNTWSQSIVDKDGNVVKTRRSDGTTEVPEEDETKTPTPKKVAKRKLQQMPTFKKGGTKCYTCGGIKAKVR